MNLEKAIKEVKEIQYSQLKCASIDELPEILRKSFLINVEAIDTVLKELQILKKENDTLWEENIKLKQLNIAYKLRIDDFAIDIHKAHAEGYQDGFKQAKFDCEMDKLDGR